MVTMNYVLPLLLFFSSCAAMYDEDKLSRISRDKNRSYVTYYAEFNSPSFIESVMVQIKVQSSAFVFLGHVIGKSGFYEPADQVLIALFYRLEKSYEDNPDKRVVFYFPTNSSKIGGRRAGGYLSKAPLHQLRELKGYKVASSSD
jgi:hypothetical protein